MVSLVALDHPFGYEERGHGARGFGSKIDDGLFRVFSQACIEVLCDVFLCEFEMGYNIL